MEKIYKFKWVILVSIIIFVGILLIIWLKPENETNLEKTDALSQKINTSTSLAQTDSVATLAEQSFVGPSQQDTQINCQLSVDANQRLIVNENTKNCFEYFITQYGENTLEQIKLNFIGYAKATYQDPLLSQLIDLWQRYLEYRGQLGSLQQPTLSQDDPKYYQAIFSQMNQLKKRFFSDYEIEGLFGIEDTYNNYTIDRMMVLEDKTLTEAEKAKKLEQLFNQLPQDWQDNIKQLNQLEDLRRLTSDIKARGGSQQEIRQMRLNLVGPEATQRLEALDTKRTEWKNKVNQYLSERDSITQSSMSDSAKQQAVDKLRQSHFSQPNEQIRVETFEGLHDRGEKLPFAE